jgi:cytochrome P450
MGAKLPPGPRLPGLIQGIGLWTRPYAYPLRLRARYGKRFTVRFPFSPPFVAITDPDEIKEVFMAPPDVLHPGEGAKVLEPLVGRNSVILLDEDPHMEQRKLMLPAFHGEKMERLTGLVAEVTEEEVAGWEAAEIELHPRLQSLTLEIILRAVFGLDPGPRLDALRESLSELLAYGDNPMTLIQGPDDPEEMERTLQRFDNFGPLQGMLTYRDRTNELMFELIEERRREANGAERDDVLTMLLEARHEDGSPMSDQELRDELMTLLVAGHETTASTLAWAFERLSREPAALANLVEDVNDDEGGDYLEAAIQETLRRRPVLPNVEPRFVKQPVTVGGWDYPTDCCLVPNAYLVHHDPEIYPDPFAFRPERFLEEPPGTYTWIPFGGGRRRCLGMSFAMLEMRIVLRSVLRRYDLASETGFEPSRRRNISVRPGRGARVGLARREAPVAVAG